MTNQFIIKHFRKKDAIKAYVIYPNKRVKLFWGIPVDGFVKIDNKLFKVDDKSFYLPKDNIQTYYYDSRVVEPLNIFNPSKPETIMTADDFDVAISAHVARDIFEASKGGFDKGTLGIILSVFSILAIIVVGYLMSDNINAIMEKLQEIQDLIELIGGM